MEMECKYITRKRLRCWESAAPGGPFCRWHRVVDSVSGAHLGLWRGVLGFLFFVHIGPYGIEAFQQLRQLIAYRKANVLFIYVDLCAMLYFGSLGMLLFYRQDGVVWPKVFVWSQALYGVYFLAFALATPSSGGALNLFDITLGLFLIMFSLTVLWPSSTPGSMDQMSIAMAVFLLSVNYLTSPAVAVVFILLFFGFLLDQYYGWSHAVGR